MTTLEIIIVIGAIVLIVAALVAFLSTRVATTSPDDDPRVDQADRPAWPATEPMHPDRLGGDQSPPGPSAREA